MPICLICTHDVIEHGRATVRQKHNAVYLRCPHCGFIFVENPHWLAEAYADPINATDTGYVARNLELRDRMRVLIEQSLNPGGRFLDFAGGYGLFVRLMRDAGYDYRWADRYCENLFARGFAVEGPLSEKFEAITMFEVMEHLEHPAEDVEQLMAHTDCLVFSTEILPHPTPQPGEWWYYALEHGQHISLYSVGSLEALAQRFSLNLATDGRALHVLSRKPVSRSRFRRLDDRTHAFRFWRAWSKLKRRRHSKTWEDHESQLSKRSGP